MQGNVICAEKRETHSPCFAFHYLWRLVWVELRASKKGRDIMIISISRGRGHKMSDPGEDSEVTAIEDESENNQPLVLSPPKDRYFRIYILFLSVGIGILVPYNSFIFSLDYFLYLYPSQKPEFIVPFAYITVTLFSILLAVSVVNIFPLHCRITYGYIMFLIGLVSVIALDFGVQNCSVSTDVGFSLTLIAIMVVGLGGGSELIITYHYLTSSLSLF